MSDAIRVAVVGVGQLGSRHARLYSDIPEARLVGVADIDFERARAVGESFGARPVADFGELLSEIDAASVAVPTSAHHEVTSRLLEGGVHVLVEKPIAGSLEEARSMVDLAARQGLVLAPGHTERHNPAVEALLDQKKDPRFVEVHRLGSFSPRSLDIDVVLDLMIHDLDIVSALVGKEVVSLEAVGVPVVTPRVDIANARLRFEGGCVANLTASRVSAEKVRKLRVFERDRYVSLDYQLQEAVRYQLVPNDGAMPSIRRDELEVSREEPLKRELADFLGAISSGKKPRVTGEDGLRALDLALRVVTSMAAAERDG